MLPLDDKSDGCKWGVEALHRASEGGHLEIVKYLVDKIFPTLVDESDNFYEMGKEEALRRASVGGHLEIVKYLVERGVGGLNEAVAHTIIPEVIEYLLSNGADKETEIQVGYTTKVSLLYNALVIVEDDRLVEVLYKCGAKLTEEEVRNLGYDFFDTKEWVKFAEGF